ncbi:hypothetical protein M3Y94_00435500 [Aphelenchoides besseyi]|nr:hypothetical protein M3Y94_00435500 [Aphelenchoides besseyi]KAI6229447.1 Palmitoyltransferase [Aphelenchoides besseyi]
MAPIDAVEDHGNDEHLNDATSIQEPSTSNETYSNEESDEEEEQINSNTTTSAPSKPIRVVEAPDWPTYLVDIDRDVGRSLIKRLMHWGPLLAMGITTTIGMTTTFEHLVHWPLTSPWALMNLSVFLFLNYCVFYNLIRASYIGGGYVTKGWRPINSQDTHRLQYCASCEGYKPPRSHHCSKCQRCVMKMDHHCPWVNNCVGHRNQVYFVRFLLFAVLGCLHALIMLSVILYHTLSIIFSPRVYRRHQSPYMIRSAIEFVFVLLSGSFAIGVILAVGVLLYTQIAIVVRNKTAIEEYICSKAHYRGLDDFVFPYDLGWKRNIREVFPKWTISFANGNGIWWPVREGCTQFSLSEEQIMQKANKRHMARVFDIVTSNSGGLFGSYKAGIRTLFCQPCSDESRIPVQVGESYAITRANKRWIYGQRLLKATEDVNDESTNDIHGPWSANPYADRSREPLNLKQALEPRGWFPRAFARQRSRKHANGNEAHD